MNARAPPAATRAAGMPADMRFSSDGSSATRCLRSSGVFLGCTLQTRSSSVATACAPRLAVLASLRGRRAPSAPMPVLAQEAGEEVRHRIALDAPLDLGLARRPPAICRAVALVDLLGGRLDVRFGRLLLLGEEAPRGRRAARRRSRGCRRSRRGSGGRSPSILLVERIVAAHRRRPAEPRLGERVDEQRATDATSSRRTRRRASPPSAPGSAAARAAP